MKTSPHPSQGSPATQLCGDDVDAGPLTRGLGQLYVVMSVLVGFEAISLGPSVRYLVILLGVGLLLLVARTDLLKIRLVAPALGLVVWSVASLAWSVSPGDTLLELAGVMLLLVTLGVASVLPLRDLLKAHVRAIQLVVAATFLTLVLDPSTALGGGAWKGGFYHKNLLATFAAFSIPWVLAFAEKRSHKIVTVTGLIVLIIGSKSATGLIGLLVGVLCWWWLRLLQRRPHRSRSDIVVTTGCLGAVAALGVWTSLSSIAAVYGKDLTLTGRTAIWEAIIVKVGERPLQGFGLGAFYSGFNINQSAELLAQVGFFHTHTHNGVLEVVLGLGLVGVVLVLMLVAMSFADGLRLFETQPLAARWLISATLVVVVMSISERTLTGAGWLSVLTVMRIVGIRMRERPEPTGEGGRPDDVGRNSDTGSVLGEGNVSRDLVAGPLQS